MPCLAGHCALAAGSSPGTWAGISPSAEQRPRNSVSSTDGRHCLEQEQPHRSQQSLCAPETLPKASSASSRLLSSARSSLFQRKIISTLELHLNILQKRSCFLLLILGTCSFKFAVHKIQ